MIMKTTHFKLIALLMLFAGLTGLQAQESTNSTGGNASGSGGTASYSVGQLVYTTHRASNGSIAQGVQQSYEVSVETGIKEAEFVNLSVAAYPNPTTDYLTLSIEKFDISNLSYRLYDMQGRVLQSQKITSNKTKIDMANFVSAIYFVKLIKANQTVKIFKIVKGE